MRMSDCETMNDILNEFAKRDPSGYLVWGSKISSAYREEAKNRENESRAANNLADALNAEVKRLTAENEKLRFDNMHLKSGQRTAGEVIIEQTNKVEAKDEENATLRTLVKTMADKLHHDYCCVDGESHFGTCDIIDICPDAGTCALVAMAREVANG